MNAIRKAIRNENRLAYEGMVVGLHTADIHPSGRPDYELCNTQCRGCISFHFSSLAIFKFDNELYDEYPPRDIKLN